MKRRAAAVLAVFFACAGIGVAVAAFSQTTTNPGNGFSAASSFLAFVKHVGSATCGGASTVVTVPAGGVAAGNTVLARVGLRDGSVGSFTPTMSDSKGNTYQRDVDQVNGSVRSVIFSAYVTTALTGGDTITVSHAAVDSSGIGVDEFAGIRNAGRLDQTATNTGTSSTPTATVNTTFASDVILGAVVHNQVAGVTQPGGGWNGLTSVSAACGGAVREMSIHGAYRIVSATGAYTYAPTLTNNWTWTETIASYRG